MYQDMQLIYKAPKNLTAYKVCFWRCSQLHSHITNKGRVKYGDSSVNNVGIKMRFSLFKAEILDVSSSAATLLVIKCV